MKYLKKHRKIFFVVVLAITASTIIIVWDKFNYPIEKLTGIVAGSSQDIKVGAPFHDSSTGTFSIKIDLGKATTDSIMQARYTAEAANTIAKMIDVASMAKSMSKATGNTTIAKTVSVIRNVLKLSPTNIAQTVLGWMTGTLASAVDQNCLSQAVKISRRNVFGGVTVYRTTNFFSEDSRVYNGYYIYSQNKWSGGCTEKRVCLQFLSYKGGAPKNCW